MYIFKKKLRKIRIANERDIKFEKKMKKFYEIGVKGKKEWKNNGQTDRVGRRKERSLGFHRSS